MSNLLKKYVKSAIALNEMRRSRKRDRSRGGSSTLRNAQASGAISSQGSSLSADELETQVNEINERDHVPVIITILDDKITDFKEDLTKFPVNKSFICFSTRDFKQNVITSLEKKFGESYESDRSDPLSLFSAYEESQNIKSIDIGLNDPVDIVYVMFTDITGIGAATYGDVDDEGNIVKKGSHFDEYQKTDDYDGYHDKKTYLAQKRKLGQQYRFSKEQYGSSYTHTSGIIKQQLSLALRQLGLVRVVKDIPNVFNEEYIERSMRTIFNTLNLDGYLEEMGYTRGRSESEIKSLAKSLHLDKDSVAASSDETLHMGGAANASRDLENALKDEGLEVLGVVNTAFDLFEMLRIDPDEVPWSFSDVFLDNWKAAGGNIYEIFDEAFNTQSSTHITTNKRGKEKEITTYELGELDDTQKEIAYAKLKKMFANCYFKWIKIQAEGARRKISEPKINPNEKRDLYQQTIEAKSIFTGVGQRIGKIETDSSGNPTNLTNKEKAYFYGTIYNNYHLAVKVLPYAKSKPVLISSPFTADRSGTGETAAQRRSRSSDSSAAAYDHNAKIKFGQKADLGKKNRKSAWERAATARLKAQKKANK